MATTITVTTDELNAIKNIRNNPNHGIIIDKGPVGYVITDRRIILRNSDDGTIYWDTGYSDYGVDDKNVVTFRFDYIDLLRVYAID